MSHKVRALSDSLMVHCLLIGGVIAIAGMINPSPRLVRLDISMLQPIATPVVKIEHGQKSKTEKVNVPIAPLPVETPSALLPQQRKSKPVTVKKSPPKPVAAKFQKRPKDDMKPVTEVAQFVPLSSQIADLTKVDINTAQPTGNPEKFAISAASASEKYLQINFGAIRRSIFANLRYPKIARRNGWTGQVEVTFTIKPDGSVSDVRIKSSSGHSMLDEQALSAIRDAAPFVPSQVASNVIMPITFRLN